MDQDIQKNQSTEEMETPINIINLSNMKKIIGFLVLMSVFALGFIISMEGRANQWSKAKNSNILLNPFGNESIFKLEYPFWKKIFFNCFKFTSIDGYVCRSCPSKIADIDVFYKNDLMGKSISNSNSNFEIYDGFKNVLFHGQSTHQGLKILKENEVIASAEINKFGTEIIIKNFKNSVIIAKILKIDENENSWKIEILDKDHVVSNYRIISIIFGKMNLFEDDLCNKSFNLVGILGLVSFCILLILISFLIYQKIQGVEKTKKQ